MRRRWELSARTVVSLCLLWLAGSGAAGAETKSEVTPENVALSVKAAIADGVSYLEKAQRSTGEFPMDVCEESAMTTCRPNGHTAATSVVLYSVDFVHDSELRPRIDAMAKRGLAFVRDQMQPDGLWRPSPKGHPGYALQVAAVEDTCINALTLRMFGHPIARTVDRILAEGNPQGGFHAFVGAMQPPPPPDKDPLHPSTRELMMLIDPVVNSDALNFLSASGKQAPSVCTYLNGVVAHDLRPGYSALYPSIYTFAYTFASAYEFGGASCLQPSLPTLQALMLKNQHTDGSWGGSSDTAFAVIALSITGYHGPQLDGGVQYLLTHQASDGSWPRELLFVVPASNWHYGSAALTSAFVVEALARYLGVKATGASRP